MNVHEFVSLIAETSSSTSGSYVDEDSLSQVPGDENLPQGGILEATTEASPHVTESGQSMDRNSSLSSDEDAFRRILLHDKDSGDFNPPVTQENSSDSSWFDGKFPEPKLPTNLQPPSQGVHNGNSSSSTSGADAKGLTTTKKSGTETATEDPVTALTGHDPETAAFQTNMVTRVAGSDAMTDSTGSDVLLSSNKIEVTVMEHGASSESESVTVSASTGDSDSIKEPSYGNDASEEVPDGVDGHAFAIDFGADPWLDAEYVSSAPGDSSGV